MEDRCVCCGDVVPEGTWVCQGCKIATNTPPCHGCTDRRMECHIYCRNYLAYTKARQKIREIEHKKDVEKSYVATQVARSRYAALQRKDQYKEI